MCFFVGNVEVGMEINRNDFNRKLAANTKIPFLKSSGIYLQI